MKIHPKQVTIAKRLRRDETDAERALWWQLRGKQLGVKFRRQQPIGPYIVDFVSFERRLVVEVDGGQHTGEGELAKDEQRTKWLGERGYRVLRFWNNDVRTNMDGVLMMIKQILEEPSSPSP